MRRNEKDIEGLNDIIIINEFLIPVCNAKEGFGGLFCFLMIYLSVQSLIYFWRGQRLRQGLI